MDLLDKAIDSASADFFNRSSEKIVEESASSQVQGLLNNFNKSVNETFEEQIREQDNERRRSTSRFNYPYTER